MPLHDVAAGSIPLDLDPDARGATCLTHRYEAHRP
jgi:hypothetical protein